MKYRTKIKIPRRGVATTYLSELKPGLNLVIYTRNMVLTPAPGDKLNIRIRKGLITLPPDINTPIICVGPGTGIAPIRSILEERVAQGAKGTRNFARLCVHCAQV